MARMGGSLGCCPSPQERCHVLYVCRCACMPAPRNLGQAASQRRVSPSVWNVCCPPLVPFDGSWGPACPATLPPFILGAGTSSQKRPPSFPSPPPLPGSPSSLVLARCFGMSSCWSPDLAHKSQAGGPHSRVCGWLRIEKVERSINFWCSGLQLCGFLGGRAGGTVAPRMLLGLGHGALSLGRRAWR